MKIEDDKFKNILILDERQRKRSNRNLLTVTVYEKELETLRFEAPAPGRVRVM